MIEVLRGNCIDVIPTIAEPFQFAFADPPFNINHPYKGFRDRFRDFEGFTRRWMKVVFAATRGVVCLHGPDHLADIYIRAAHDFGFQRIAWLQWHYRFGQCSRRNWIDSRCHCLIYSTVPRYTWHPKRVLVESDRVKRNDKRIHDHPNGGRRLPGTTWGIPSDGKFWGRVTGTNAERWKDHPNQLPEKYLERLILPYTKRRDRILDPFGGSGTTAVVADALDRDCVTIDISEFNVNSIRGRLKRGAVRVRRIA